MNYYKSWSGLNKQLSGFLCDELKDRITYFLTRYHQVHNAYGRASICLDGVELVIFSWVELYKQESDCYDRWVENGEWDYDTKELREKWAENATVSEYDFLKAATDFLQCSLEEALQHENVLIRVFAIMDRRVGKRTLSRIREAEEYKTYPKWVQQFYELRLNL